MFAYLVRYSNEEPLIVISTCACIDEKLIAEVQDTVDKRRNSKGQRIASIERLGDSLIGLSSAAQIAEWITGAGRIGYPASVYWKSK